MKKKVTSLKVHISSAKSLTRSLSLRYFVSPSTADAVAERAISKANKDKSEERFMVEKVFFLRFACAMIEIM